MILTSAVNTCSLLLSDKRASEVKLRSATLVYRGISVYIKRHLMSGNEFACSLGSSSAKNRLGVNTKNALKNAGE